MAQAKSLELTRASSVTEVDKLKEEKHKLHEELVREKENILTLREELQTKQAEVTKDKDQQIDELYDKIDIYKDQLKDAAKQTDEFKSAVKNLMYKVTDVDEDDLIQKLHIIVDSRLYRFYWFRI